MSILALYQTRKVKPLLTHEQRAHNYQKRLASLYVQGVISDKEYNLKAQWFKLINTPTQTQS